MSLQRLEVTGVRNLQPLSLSELSQINIFYGENGSGKTSVLESIHMLSQAKSFRSHKLNPVINHNAEDCIVFGSLSLPGAVSSSCIPVGVRRSKRDAALIKVDGQLLRSAAQLTENLPVQVINSDTFDLLEGSPAVRRRFLDWGVFHVEHQFHAAWLATQRCLKQRNSLLRHAKMTNSQLAAWTQELAKHGEELTAYRHEYFLMLKPVFERLLAGLLQLEGLQLSFSQGWEKGKPLEQLLFDNLPRELEQGRTLSSPHKADIKIRLNGNSAGDVLSRGQQKLVVCALRLAQGHVLAERTGRHCVYLIDDLPAELDGKHRQAFCYLLEELDCQVFITCVDQQDLSGSWSDKARIKLFHVEHGCVKPA